MRTLLLLLTLLSPLLLTTSCQKKPAPWDGPRLTTIRDQLTVEQLHKDSILPLMDMSYYAKPAWGNEASHHFSGSISFADTELTYPKGRAFYPGENIFPAITMDFIAQGGEFIPIQKEKIARKNQSKSLWDVVVGTGKTWQEEKDGGWSRASFPLTLTDRYVGQARNCVATFVYQTDTISKVCVQCSQETADLNDHQVGNIQVMLPADYQAQRYVDSAQVIEQHHLFKSRRLAVHPLSTIDKDNKIADLFEKPLYTNASTSLGALLMDEKLYLNPPQTRHGLYPYPDEMRHGVYSVTKSMAGALSLFYLARRYGEEIFDELITDHVSALADHPAWHGVTFSHTLNMVTGTEGGEGAEHLLNILILARTAEESIHNIARLGDYPAGPGEQFNYASTNLFVLSYAMQNYVAAKEGQDVYYWDLVRENVLVPIGANYFTTRHTLETDSSKGIPILAYGALPTLDEAAKIALLLTNDGNYKGQQLLHTGKTQEAFGRTAWTGHTTNNDYRGEHYQHSFWSKRVSTPSCKVNVSYMLGYGGNYVLFFPSKVVVFRFMDEYDLDIRKLVRRVEKIRSSCE